LLIYVDYLGNLRYLDIGAEFSSYQKAISYLVGSTFVGDPSLDSDYINDKNWFVEKGVPLWYVVTDLIDVTLSLDISRNVANNVYEWSIGGRRGSFEDTSTLAAFDNLEAAFSWSSALNSQYGADDNNKLFVLVGDSSVISGRPISQSAYSTVVGSDLARVTLAGSGITEGMWVLGTNCEVRDVKISASSLYTSVVFRLDTGCCITRCEFSGSMNDNYFCGPRSNSYYVSNVVIDSNILDGGNACLITNAVHASNSNWVVRNNYVCHTVSSASYRSIIQLNGSGHSITDNILHTYSTATASISGFSSSGIIKSSVLNNYFYLGRVSSNCSYVGVNLSGACNDLRINCNYFSAKDLTNGGEGVGILASELSTNLNKVEIKNNFFNILFHAIYIAGKVNYLNVCDNYIYGGHNNKDGSNIEFDAFNSATFGGAVITIVPHVNLVSSDSFYDINIINNKICGYSFTSSGGGISFYIYDVGDAFTYGKNLNIIGNSIDSIICRNIGLGDIVYGIAAYLSPRVGEVTADISNNSVTNFVVEGSQNSSIYGIAAVGDSIKGSANILNNVVSGTVSVNATTVTALGIHVSDLKFCEVKNNSISFYDGGFANLVTVGVRNQLCKVCSITNNSMVDSKVGIISKDNDSCNIISNKIVASACGIELRSTNRNTVIGNDIKVYTVYDYSSLSYSTGITLNASNDAKIDGCSVFLTNLASVGTKNSCVAVFNVCKGFSISNCSFTIDPDAANTITDNNMNIKVGAGSFYFSISNCVCKIGRDKATSIGNNCSNIEIYNCSFFSINGCDCLFGGDSVGNIGESCRGLFITDGSNFKVTGCTTKFIYSGTVGVDCYQAWFSDFSDICSISNNIFDNTKSGGTAVSQAGGLYISGVASTLYRVVVDNNIVHGSKTPLDAGCPEFFLNGYNPATTSIITYSGNIVTLNPRGAPGSNRSPKINLVGLSSGANAYDNYDAADAFTFVVF
jgi:hypothetical protein